MYHKRGQKHVGHMKMATYCKHMNFLALILVVNKPGNSAIFYTPILL